MKVWMTAGEGADLDRCRALAETFCISYTEPRQADSLPDGENRLLLVLTGEGLSLTDGRLTLRGDFASMYRRIRKDNLAGELLVKAARRRGGGNPVRVLDATAGMGEDSFLLAAAGHTVTMVEQDPVIAALTTDALQRAADSSDPMLAQIAGRMRLVHGDSIAIMRNMARDAQRADMIYLDPMFPERHKSGLVKKKFQLLSQLQEPCRNGEELLAAAIEAGAERIIVKRPQKGPFLGNVRPSYSLQGKVVRYDCIVLPGNGLPNPKIVL